MTLRRMVWKHRLSSGVSLGLCLGLCAPAGLPGWGGASEALARPPSRSSDASDVRDPFVVATTALTADRSEKVRVQAALVLGRAGESRGAPFLIRALADRSPTVRAMAAQSLGYVGDEQARPPLEVAARDPHPLVKRHAAAALRTLSDRLTPSPVAVKAMGDKTRKASGELRDRMRRFVTAELRGFGKGGAGAAGYTVDGAIKTLSMSGRSDMVEVKCSVELVLSTGGRAIVMMSSGEAIVQRQRRQFRPVMRSSMELEALQHAVKGASDELRQHLAANVP